MDFGVALLLAALTVAPADRLSMADRLFNRGNYAEAAREYAALVGEPSIDSTTLEFRRIRSAYQLKDYAQAREMAVKYLKNFPYAPEADEIRFIKAMTSNDRLADLKALDVETLSAEVRVRVLCELGAATSQIDYFDRALKLQPKGEFAAYAHFRRAALNAASRDKARQLKAIAEFTELAFGAANPYAEDALYSAVLTAEECGRTRDAQSLAKRFLKRYPNNLVRARQLRYLLAVIELNAGNYSAALEYCGDDVGAETDRIRELARARRDFEQASGAGNAEAMLSSARRSAELSKSAADRLRYGWALEKAGRTDEAETVYESLNKDFPNSPEAADALYRRGISLIRSEKWSAAALSLQKSRAIGLSGDRQGAALYWQGMATLRLNHLEEATALLKEALKAGIGPDESREAKLALCDIKYNAGNREAALKGYAELIHQGATDRMSAKKLYLLGTELPPEESKQCGAALLGKNTPEWRQSGYALIGNAEARLGHTTAAVEAWNKALDEKVTTDCLAPVVLELAQYRLSIADPTAEELFKKAVSLNRLNAEARAAAYLGLAECALSRSDAPTARGYATIVLTLFETTRAAKRAAEIAGKESAP